MTWIPTAIQGGTALLGMLGSGGSGGGKAAASTADANNEARRLGDVGNWYADEAGAASKYANGERGDQQSAYDKLLGYYATDPNNDAAYARDLNRATNGLEVNSARLQNENLAAGSANGQMVPGGGPSGMTAGTDAYLKGLEALGINAGQVNVANSNQAKRVQNMKDSYGLSTGQYGQDQAVATQAKGAETGIDQGLMDFYAQQARQQQAQQNMEQGQEMGALGSLGTSLGKSLAPVPKLPALGANVGSILNGSGDGSVPQTGGAIGSPYVPPGQGGAIRFNPVTGRFE